MRAAALALVGALASTSTACDSSGAGYVGLPDDQFLASEHFRYHARAGTKVDPTILDRLERHRSEFNAWFGVTNDVTDYFLYTDADDLARNATPCHGRGCVDGTSIHIDDPFHEHELVHAWMYPTNLPHSFVVEGLAQRAACLTPQTAAEVDPADWRRLIGASTIGDGPDVQAVYDFGHRLVSWMLETGDTARFVDYYRNSRPWTDPDLFGADFTAYWGRSLDDVAVEIGRSARYARSECSCASPALPVDGTAHRFVASQEYRVIDAAGSEDVRLELESATGVPLQPGACSGADETLTWAWPSAKRPTVTVARLPPGRHAVRAVPGFQGTVQAHARQQPFGDPSCEAAAAAPLALGARDAIFFVDHQRAKEATWFAVVADRPYQATSSFGGFLFVCDACRGGQCTGSPPETGIPVPVPVGTSIIGVLSGKPDPQDALVTLTEAR